MKNKGKILILLGLLLIAAALFLTAYNLNDSVRAKKSALQAVNMLESALSSESTNEGPSNTVEREDTEIQYETMVIPDYVLYPNMEMPVKTINEIDYVGIIRIPVLELELPIISQWSYPNLKTAPCRYSGSAYQNNLILCGHDYASHFGNLKLLQQGEVISFVDMDGNEFQYEVAALEILQPTASDEMESGDWDLSLFTCTVGGQSRVTIRCKLSED